MNEAYISVMDALYIGIRSWRRKGCRPFCLLCSLFLNRMIMTLKSITSKACSDLCITAGCLEKGQPFFYSS